MYFGKDSLTKIIFGWVKIEGENNSGPTTSDFIICFGLLTFNISKYYHNFFAFMLHENAKQ